MVRSNFNDLSALLWRQRDLLDLLLGRLDDGINDTDGLFRSLSSLELHRAILAREVGVELGVDGEPTLADLVRLAPADWIEVLADHRQALRTMADKVNARLAGGPDRQGLQRSIREFLD